MEKTKWYYKGPKKSESGFYFLVTEDKGGLFDDRGLFGTDVDKILSNHITKNNVQFCAETSESCYDVLDENLTKKEIVAILNKLGLEHL